jgi:hypothetical protein
MINETELIDRFGEVDFLGQLWDRAKGELPGRLEDLRHQLSGAADGDGDLELLGKKLHKLRGLVSNFLTERKAVPLLIECEKMVEEESLAEIPAYWKAFEAALEDEVQRLDAWIAENS